MGFPFFPELDGLGYFRGLALNREREADQFLPQSSPPWPCGKFRSPAEQLPLVIKSPPSILVGEGRRIRKLVSLNI